jgi:hypothetical protein
MSDAEMFIVMISWLVTLVLAFWLGWKRGHDAGIRGIVHIYKETLLSCSGENKLPKCPLPHRPTSPGRATLLLRTVDLTLTPDFSARTLFAGPSALYPPWSRTVGEPRAAARLFHF